MGLFKAMAFVAVTWCVSQMAAAAAVTTVGFTAGQPWTGGLGYNTSNYTEQGYRFSPPCHIDYAQNVSWIPFDDNAGIGWDQSGCDQYNNANYLGAHPRSGWLYMDNNGLSFDLQSFVGFTRSGIEMARFRSSKGGDALVWLTNDRTEFTFAGDEWTNVQWVEITNGGGAPAWWLDSITMSSVPEPTSIALVALCGAIAAGASRRKRSS